MHWHIYGFACICVCAWMCMYAHVQLTESSKVTVITPKKNQGQQSTSWMMLILHHGNGKLCLTNTQQLCLLCLTLMGQSLAKNKNKKHFYKSVYCSVLKSVFLCCWCRRLSSDAEAPELPRARNQKMSQQERKWAKTAQKKTEADSAYSRNDTAQFKSGGRKVAFIIDQNVEYPSSQALVH